MSSLFPDCLNLFNTVSQALSHSLRRKRSRFVCSLKPLPQKACSPRTTSCHSPVLQGATLCRHWGTTQPGQMSSTESQGHLDRSSVHRPLCAVSLTLALVAPTVSWALRISHFPHKTGAKQKHGSFVLFCFFKKKKNPKTMNFKVATVWH